MNRTYDNDGNLWTVTDWKGHKTTFGYDPEGYLQSITRPNGTSARYVDNAEGALTSLTDVGGTTGYTRSFEGLLNAITPPKGSQQTLSYDGAQRLTSGSYQYNAADNLTQTQIGSGSAILIRVRLSWRDVT